jgi:hypothetical protein
LREDQREGCISKVPAWALYSRFPYLDYYRITKQNKGFLFHRIVLYNLPANADLLNPPRKEGRRKVRGKNEGIDKVKSDTSYSLASTLEAASPVVMEPSGTGFQERR